MQKRFCLGLILVALLQSGCVTHYQSQPMVEGELLDSHGQPLAGASVTYSSNAGETSALSDNNGRFSFPAKHKWVFFLPIGPMDWVHRAGLHFQTATQQYDYLAAGGLGNAHELDGVEIGVICQLPAATELSPPEVCHRVDINKVTGNQPPN